MKEVQKKKAEEEAVPIQKIGGRHTALEKKFEGKTRFRRILSTKELPVKQIQYLQKLNHTSTTVAVSSRDS